MTSKPWRIAEAKYRELKSKRPFSLAVIPFGSLEPHNYHLPYATDTIQVEAIADRACEKAWKKGARVALLPAFPYGIDWNLIRFPMTVHVSPGTQLAFLRDLVKSLEAHRVDKLLILNGHGGNEFKHMVRQLSAETKMFVAATNWFEWLPELQKKIFAEVGNHADEVETSLCQALVPGLVRLEWADAGRVRGNRFPEMESGEVFISRPWHLLTTASGHGNPKKASAEKGRKFLAALAEGMGNFFARLARAKRGGKFPYQ